MLLGLPDFDMVGADCVEAACALLARYGADAQLVAGGTDLFIRMKHRNQMPRTLINIKRIRGLDRLVEDSDGGLRIGALNTAQSIKDSPLIGERVRILSQAAGVLGTLQIRNLATLGGNLANASPSAEFAPPLLVLEASVRCVGNGGERSIPVTELFLSPGKSALKPDEVLTEVQVPKSPPNTQALYLKHSLRRMDVSIAAAAVRISLDGDRCLQARIALGAVAPVPFRARRAEEFLKGARLSGGASDAELFEEAGRLATAESSPIDDLRGHAEYRKRIVGMLVKQGLEQAVVRASA